MCDREDCPQVIEGGRKVCRRCRENKLYSEFTSTTGRADGHQIWCKSCVHINDVTKKRWVRINCEEYPKHKAYATREDAEVSRNYSELEFWGSGIEVVECNGHFHWTRIKQRRGSV